MAEIEAELNNGGEQPKPLHFEWLVPVFFRPRRTLEQIQQQTNGVWLAPMLIITVLAVILIFVGGGVRKTQAQMQAPTIPPGFEYMTPEEQAQFQEGMQASSGPIFTHVLPGLGLVGGVWIQWILLASFLHLSLTLAGSRSNSTAAMNLVGWASLPVALRLIVQIIYVLSTKQLVASPGLSGLIPADATGFVSYLGPFLSQVDLYFLWMVVLILVGVVPMTGLPRGRAWIATFSVIIILMALFSVPGLIAKSLGGLNTTRPFFFF